MSASGGSKYDFLYQTLRIEYRIVILNYNAAACSLETRRDMGHFDARRSTLAPSLLACRICVWTSAVPPAILYIWLNSTRMHLLQPLARLLQQVLRTMCRLASIR